MRQIEGKGKKRSLVYLISDVLYQSPFGEAEREEGKGVGWQGGNNKINGRGCI